MTSDELFMQRALDLARLGIGHVSPNPRVGCVVVNEGTIIGEGWHEKFGGPHAEVNALSSVTDQQLLRSSCVYVNLEPCSHFGKTPPCADLLIEKGVKRIVVANRDPNPRVNGAGIAKLRAAGIEVVENILTAEGKDLNKRFFTSMEKSRPYIILKWAETADGFLAHENGDSKWISNEVSRQAVHRWRAEEDAILVGPKTVAHDNPSLNVRDWSGRAPKRIVIDRFLRLDDTLKVFDGTQETWCYNVLKHEEHPHLKLLRIAENNFVEELIQDLHRRGIQSLIVEGGAQILQAFIDHDLWDEVRRFVAPRVFHRGIAAPCFRGVQTERHLFHLDQLLIYSHG